MVPGREQGQEAGGREQGQGPWAGDRKQGQGAGGCEKWKSGADKSIARIGTMRINRENSEKEAVHCGRRIDGKVSYVAPRNDD